MREQTGGTPRNAKPSFFATHQFSGRTCVEKATTHRSLRPKSRMIGLTIPSVGVKEGLSCVIFRATVARKTPNLALPSLQHSVMHTGSMTTKFIYFWVFLLQNLSESFCLRFTAKAFSRSLASCLCLANHSAISLCCFRHYSPALPTFSKSEKLWLRERRDRRF